MRDIPPTVLRGFEAELGHRRMDNGGFDRNPIKWAICIFDLLFNFRSTQIFLSRRLIFVSKGKFKYSCLHYEKIKPLCLQIHLKKNTIKFSSSVENLKN